MFFKTGAYVGGREENIRAFIKLFEEINLLIFNIGIESGSLAMSDDPCRVGNTAILGIVWGFHNAEGRKGPPLSCLLSAYCNTLCLLNRFADYVNQF